jgi:hypothetical protein
MIADEQRSIGENPEVLTTHRILPSPDISSMLFFGLNVIANGPSHSPDQTLKGVVSLPTVPEVSSFFAASPYHFTSTFASATFP